MTREAREAVDSLNIASATVTLEAVRLASSADRLAVAARKASEAVRAGMRQ